MEYLPWILVYPALAFFAVGWKKGLSLVAIIYGSVATAFLVRGIRPLPEVHTERLGSVSEVQKEHLKDVMD